MREIVREAVRTVHRHFLFFAGPRQWRAVRGELEEEVKGGASGGVDGVGGIIGRLQRGICVVSVLDCQSGVGQTSRQECGM